MNFSGCAKSIELLTLPQVRWVFWRGGCLVNIECHHGHHNHGIDRHELCRGGARHKQTHRRDDNGGTKVDLCIGDLVLRCEFII